MPENTEKSKSSPDDYESMFTWCLAIRRVESGIRDLSQIIPKNDPYIQMILAPILEELPQLEKCRDYLLDVITKREKQNIKTGETEK